MGDNPKGFLCPECNGTGEILHQYGPDLLDVDCERCEKCKGTGTIIENEPEVNYYE